MKKKRVLKSWLIKVLSWVLGSWIVFVATTIDSIGNKTYDIILIVWTALAIGSFVLLDKYSNALDYNEQCKAETLYTFLQWRAGDRRSAVFCVKFTCKVFVK